MLSSTLGRNGSFLGLENYYIISDHFNYPACLGLSTFSHGQSWVLGAGRAGEYQLLPVLQWWTEAGVYVPQLPPLGERISGNAIPRLLRSSCPWLFYFPLGCPTFSPGSLTVTSCSHFPARLNLDQKRETSGNSFFFSVVVAGYMISIIFCLESRVNKIGKAMNSRPDYSSGAQCGSNSKLFNEASA